MQEVKKFKKDIICKFLILYFGLNQLDSFGKGKEGIVNYFKKIRSIQSDPLNIIGKNTEIILQSRFSNFKPALLHDMMYKDYTIIDGFDKEACIYLNSDWGNFSLIREEMSERDISILKYRGNEVALDYLKETYEFVLENPNTSSSDHKIDGGKKGRWGSSNLFNCALNHLWCEGKIGISSRKGSKKFYSDINLLVFENKECIKEYDKFIEWYIIRRLDELGVYWLKKRAGWQGFYLNDLDLVKKTIKNLIGQNKVVEIEIEGVKDKFYMTKTAYQELLECSNINLVETIRLIAPLDNLIWDRELVKTLFNFDYTWEVYLPEKKRKYGYYVLPILYKDKFIGRLEPKKDKQIFHKLVINQIWFEDDVYDCEKIRSLIDNEILRFNQTFINKNID